MSAPASPTRPRATAALVVLSAALVAVGSAREYAGGFNDGSRLATVEALVDHHTLAIDDSIFVRPPPGSHFYDPAYPHLVRHGTGDKILVGGRFYSDKPPVPAFGLAAVYAALKAAFGLRAAERPGQFCYAMTLASSGLAYVASVWCVYRLAGALRLMPGWRLGLTASFAFCTVALPYVRQVNGHIWLLAAACAALLLLTRWVREAGERRWPLVAVGFLAGFAYAVEQPTGGLLLACAAAVAAGGNPSVGRHGWFRRVVLVVVGAAPWLVLHHAVTYAYAGTFGPPNADPAVFRYPGSTFEDCDLTGRYRHEHVGDLFVYAGGLLFGQRGFLQANLPLFLTPPALWLIPRAIRERRLAWAASSWGLATWFVFALLSTNFSGYCCSIRWFVPLLAAGYLLLGLLLRERLDWRGDFVVLSAWGAILGGLMWWAGPWDGEMPRGFWAVQVAAAASWGFYRLIRLYSAAAATGRARSR
jgi:hypothetical protein